MLKENTQRLALVAVGRAWTMLGSRENSKPACPGGLSREKYSKMAANPTCRSVAKVCTLC